MQLERLWSAWRAHLLQQRRLYTLAGALRIAVQSRSVLCHLAFLRSWSHCKALYSAVIARTGKCRRTRAVRFCFQVNVIGCSDAGITTSAVVIVGGGSATAVDVHVIVLAYCGALVACTDCNNACRLQGWDSACSCAVGARRIARARAAARCHGCTAKLFSFWSRRSRDRRVPRINRNIAVLHR